MIKTMVLVLFRFIAFFLFVLFSPVAFSQECEPIENIVLIEHFPFGGVEDVGSSGSVSIGGSGDSINLMGNRWRAVISNYMVTADTMMEFDFSSTQQGEIHGIGFDNDLNLSANNLFQVYGSENYGIRDFNYLGDIKQHFIIPVGQYFQGQFQYIKFVMDDDLNAAGDSTFSNIIVYENGAKKDCEFCFPIKSKNGPVAVICL